MVWPQFFLIWAKPSSKVLSAAAAPPAGHTRGPVASPPLPWHWERLWEHVGISVG